MNDALFINALRLLPKNAWSRAVGVAAHAELPRPITRAAIRAFARAFKIDVEEADRPLSEFRTVGDFFTRRLRPGARPIDRRPGFATSPADGHILNFGASKTAPSSRPRAAASRWPTCCATRSKPPASPTDPG